MSEDGAAPLDRLDAIAASLAEVAAAVHEQREDLRLALEVLVEVASRLDQLEVEEPASVPATSAVEVGALMGATQAAWLRLEQRLESEFDDIQRQLRALHGLGEAPTPALERPMGSTVPSGQLRRAAATLRESVRGLRRERH